MGLKLIQIIMLHLTSNIEYSRQLLEETKTILLLTGPIESNRFDFDICFISPQKACLLCALCGKATTSSPCHQSKPVKNPFLNKQVCTKFINLIIENNLSHRSGARSTSCNIAMKVSPLLSQFFI